MFKKFFTLFKIARILAKSEALEIIYKIHQPPIIIKILLKVVGFSFKKSTKEFENLSDEEKLCNSDKSLNQF